ncbi:alpha/beta fold hydrolase [bacterium]|nr:alpha/beta fold hydrolase [bacterium]
MHKDRKWPRLIAIYSSLTVAVLAILTMLVAGRGRLFAEMIGGTYPVKALVRDVLGLTLCIGFIVLVSTLLRNALKKIVSANRPLVSFGLLLMEILVIALLGGTFLLSTIQLFPQRIIGHDHPKKWGLPCRDISLDVDGLTLSGWFLPGQNAQAPIILVTHGLNANKENFLHPVQILNRRGFQVCIFDFRGHGHSSGHLVTMGYHEARDIEAIQNWLTRTHPGVPIYALAYSMGGAAVIRAASRQTHFTKIVLDSTFYDLVSVAEQTILEPYGPIRPFFLQAMRFWGWLWAGFDLYDHRPGDLLPLLSDCPLFLIHGTQDRVIPCTESLKLFAATDKKAELWLIEGFDHLQGISHPDYFNRICTFFGQSQQTHLTL